MAKRKLHKCIKKTFLYLLFGAKTKWRIYFKYKTKWRIYFEYKTKWRICASAKLTLEVSPAANTNPPTPKSISPYP